MHHWRRRDLLGGLLAAVLPPLGCAQGPQRLGGQVVPMAFIDPLSGPAADIGRNSLSSWEFMARALADKAGDVRFKVAGFDNKGSPQESVNALKAAIDQGFRYIIQGNGSGVTAALLATIERHNTRYPQRAVMLINYAAMDPSLTAEQCSYWHFRIDADTAMKMRALTRYLGQQAGLRKVALLNQNYAHGQQFALFFRREIEREAPAIEVVSEEFHPAFALDDFSGYVQRIQASGAQALVTGNWGADLRGLIRALQSQGVWLPVFAYYPSLASTPRLLADTGEQLPVYQVATNHTRQEGEVGALAQAFRRQTGEDLVVYAAYDGIRMLLHAMSYVGSTDPVAVAARLSGMIFGGFNGPVSLRADDHQLQKGVYISRWQKVAGPNETTAEATGYAFVPVAFMPGSDLASVPNCRMHRP